ncbi:hypothetical protein [Kribbella lupini]|uniref:Type VII secretion system (Wss) protein ESAT-6 n=1 Tax=Kribbella lupini TaxID=291602 RepID=A0ABP4NAA4_9ACTN
MTDHRPEDRSDERTPGLTDADFSDRPTDQDGDGSLRDTDAHDNDVRDTDVRDNDVRDTAVRDTGDNTMSDDRLARAAEDDSLVGDRTDSTDDQVTPANEPAAAAATTQTSTDGPLVAEDAAVDFRSRWEVIQQGFVDDPRQAVSEADKLVDDLLKRLSATFDQQHQDLERQWSDGEPSTEDLRGALQKYRAFFQRLLAL